MTKPLPAFFRSSFIVHHSSFILFKGKETKMTTKKMAAPRTKVSADGSANLLKQYGCGPIELTGTDHALYERHLLFDNAVKIPATDSRGRFEAFARSVRDILSQRWVLTEDTYDRENP